jgi:hypothetical protein
MADNITTTTNSVVSGSTSNSSTSTRKPPQTAASRALQLPELLATILQHIADDHANHWDAWDARRNESCIIGRDGVLSRCGRVSKLWHHEAMRLLWAHPNSQNSYPRASLWWFFAPLGSLARRQHYADFVEEAVLATVEEGGDEAQRADAALAGVGFPRLAQVLLFVNVGADQDWVRNGVPYRGLRVPRIAGEAVARMQLDPAFQFMGSLDSVNEKEMSVVLEEIPVSEFLSILGWGVGNVRRTASSPVLSSHLLLPFC